MMDSKTKRLVVALPVPPGNDVQVLDAFRVPAISVARKNTDMFLRSVHSHLSYQRVIGLDGWKPAVSMASVTNDIRRNPEYGFYRREYRRLSQQLQSQYKTELVRWQTAYKEAKTRFRRQLLTNDRLISYFVVNHLWGDSVANPIIGGGSAADPGLGRDARSVRFGDRGYTFFGPDRIAHIIERAIRDPKGTLNMHLQLDRFIYFLKTYGRSELDYLRSLYRRVESRLALKGLYVLEVDRVYKTRKWSYSRLDLSRLLSQWLVEHPVPKRPALSAELMRVRSKMNDAIMFHTGAAYTPVRATRIRSAVRYCTVEDLLRTDVLPGRMSDTRAPGVCGFRYTSLGIDHDSGVVPDPSGDLTRSLVDIDLDAAPRIQQLAESVVGVSPALIRRGELHPVASADQFVTANSAVHYQHSADMAALRYDSPAQFNLMRSIGELKDLPETIKFLVSSPGFVTNAPRSTVRILSQSRLIGKLSRSTLAWAIAAHLTYKFGIAPTYSDVRTVMDEGVAWAVSARRHLSAIVAALGDMVHRVTYRRRYTLDTVDTLAGTGDVAVKLPPAYRQAVRDAILGRLAYANMQAPSFRLTTGGMIRSPFDATPEPPVVPVQPPSWGQPVTTVPALSDFWRDWGEFETEREARYAALHANLEGPARAFLSVCGTAACLAQSRLFARFTADMVKKALGYDNLVTLLSSFDPLLVAWELYPLSFVVDWFLNLNQVIRAVARKMASTSHGVEPDKQGVWFSGRFPTFVGDVVNATLPDFECRLTLAWLHRILHFGTIYHDASGDILSTSWSSGTLGLITRPENWKTLLATTAFDICRETVMQGGEYGEYYLYTPFTELGLVLHPDSPDVPDTSLMRDHMSMTMVRYEYMRCPLVFDLVDSLMGLKIQTNLNLDKVITLLELLVPR